MVGGENRRAATIKVVSTGSAGGRHLQPGISSSESEKGKPSVRGHWTEGSLVRSSRY